MEDVTRVVLAQGYCLLQNTLIERLDRVPWIEVCAVTPAVENMEGLIFQHRPHVIIASISPKCSAGMASLKRFKREFVGIGMLAFSCDLEFETLHAGMALRAGFDGYVSSADTPDDLIAAIRSVKEGKKYISPQAKLRRKKVGSHEAVLAALSNREAEVFCLTGCGHVPKGIAEMMNLSVKTVESYRERIRAKMNLSGGAELLYSSVSFMRSAARWGMDDSDNHQMIRKLLSTTA